jgi:hypothetical protein
MDNIRTAKPTLWFLPTFGDGTANGREVSDRQFKRPLIKNRLGLPLYCPLHGNLAPLCPNSPKVAKSHRLFHHEKFEVHIIELCQSAFPLTVLNKGIP